MFKKQYGNGEKVFIGFHGWAGDHRTFEPLVPFLPKDVSLFSVDLPGYGKSSKPASWSVELLLSLIVKEIKNIKCNSFTIVGSCSGAILALLTSEKIPERINQLVLIDPFAYTPWYFKIFLNRYLGKQVYNITFNSAIGRWITNISLTHRRTKDSNLTNSFKDINHSTVYEYLRLLDSAGDYRRFNGLPIPIKIIYGNKTFKAVKKSIKMWLNILPKSKAYELSEAAHLPIEEATKNISRLIFSDETK